MSRGHRKLRVFTLADSLVGDVYLLTRTLPTEERYGFQVQMRRAAVSAATNIVEGSTRRTTREYAQFLRIATGSSAEVLYLLELAIRLELVADDATRGLVARYAELVKGLKALVNALERRERGSPPPSGLDPKAEGR